MSEVLLLSLLYRGENRYGCFKCLAKGYYSSKRWSWNLNLGSGILDPSFFTPRSIYLLQNRNVVFSISSNLLDCENLPCPLLGAFHGVHVSNAMLWKTFIFLMEAQRNSGGFPRSGSKIITKLQVLIRIIGW